MESGRIFFDPSCNSSNMLFLGNGGDSVFRGVVRPMMGMEESSKRRPFFSTAEDLYDDEYYDEQLPEKKRRLTSDQVHLLEKSFEEENKLEPDRKTQLAKKLGLQPRQVAVWFQNRRARWKTKQLERDYDKLKAAYDSLQANYDSILKENNIFKAELISLTEKLQPKESVGEPIGLQQTEPIQPDAPPSLELAVKVEDRVSDGSSAVVDDEGPQLVDSGDSYFPSNDEYPAFVARFDRTNSEEDDGSDDNRGSYFTNVFSVAEQQEPVGWFMWSS